MAVRNNVPSQKSLADSVSVSKLEFVQKILWTNAGFNSLRKLKHLREYTERWDVSLPQASQSCD